MLELHQNIPSPKRGIPERQGIHAWLPYYAGYSAAFVSQILDELAVPGNRLILDPMNGSGTTTVVAQQRGLPVIGCDLNPVMASIARAKDASLPAASILLSAVRATVDLARDLEVERPSDPRLTTWFADEALADLTRLRLAIPQQAFGTARPLHATLRSCLPARLQASGGSVRDFLDAVLLVTARRVSNATRSKNPTWIKHGNRGLDCRATFEVFLSVAEFMTSDLTSTFSDTLTPRCLVALEGDARALPIHSSTIDLVVTSPPYLTRIDYAVSTTPELRLLAYESDCSFRRIRTMLMGSPCVQGGAYEISSTWGPTCRRVLGSVACHYSKASSTYYFKTHVQYFRDAEAILREFLRVLKPSALAILVIQDSWYKDIHVPLADIYTEMALALGARSVDNIRTEVVQRHIGFRNTRARQYKKGALHEHVLMIRG